MFLYNIQIFQQLEDRDFAAWTWFISFFPQNMQSDCSSSDRIILSDECDFYLYEKFHKQNVKRCGTESLHEYLELLQDSERYALEQQFQWTKL